MGQFRLRNPAVGAGLQTKLDDKSYCRQFKDPSKNIDNAVVIHYGKTDSVLVGKCFADGTEVQDAVSGKTYVVENGKVAAQSDTAVLLEIKR